MKNTQLGFLTTSSIIAAVIVSLLVGGFSFVKGGMLFSPDALNARTGAPLGGVSSHAEIGGQCSVCHAPFWSTSSMADRCVVCHTDVAAQWQDPTTLHGVLLKDNSSLSCRNCHPDHRGPDAPLLDLSNATFIHGSFGFSISSHQVKTDGSSFTCDDCHARIYLGFDVNICTTCHFQMAGAFTQTHVLDFGVDCLSCHDGAETYGHNFDHARVAFPLTGKHTQASCAQCHVNTRSLADLKATSQDCNSCHSNHDIHQGRIGTDCGSCHTPEGWTPAKYDHSLSSFKLIGQHASTACGNCHVHHILQGTLTDCYSCHTLKDIHKGSEGFDCSGCHDPSAWKPAIYDHGLSIFKLTGKHAVVQCDVCHANNVLKGTPTDCYSCHQLKDTHLGSLGTDCGSCHSTNSWKPSTYNHNLSSFKLTGQHITVACVNCHINGLFKGTPADCYSCHATKDAHNGQFGTGCVSCHSTNAWKPATFDHNLSTFKLTGKHVNVACASCHINGVFKGTPIDCYSCHAPQDPHAGQFGTGCVSCHSTSGWKPASFNHNLSSFQLTGQHVNVSCSSCHINGVYKSTPTNCYACHASNDAHGGQYGTSCGSCHSTSGWKPASFNHNLSSFQLTGQHVNVSCSSCHVNGLYKGTPTNCYACHASNDAHGGQYGTSCGSCHSTSGWKPASFNHNLSSFQLTGQHVNVSCSSCHINGVYKGTPTNCYACHASNDAHGGQFGTNCGSCHSTSGWKPASFNHSTSGFPLTGAHSGLACTQCHAGGNYSGLSPSCGSCHTAPSTHSGFGTNCAQCHSTSNWSANFTHSNGCDGNCATHRQATCVDCHPVSYSTYTCLKCHKSNNPGN